MPYAIMASFDGRGSARNWEFTDIVYDDGAEAGLYVKGENSYAEMARIQRRYKAIKIGLDDPRAWREREAARLNDGTYQKVPWADKLHTTDMFEHVDPNDGTKVRFIASHTDGLQGRYTSMSPGRFLRRFYGPIDTTLLDKWCAMMGLDLTTSQLKIARSPEEIIDIYTTGPHSCMSYDLEGSNFSKVDQHPTSVYGDSDLGVAYIERYGEITARCLVWPDKKKHGRIYGDRERLLERLKDNDYVEDWDFTGARIRQLRTQEGNNLILPYLDGEMGAILDGDDWLILSDRPHIIGKSPYGLSTTSSCYRCGSEGVPLCEHYDDPDDDEPEYICEEGCK